MKNILSRAYKTLRLSLILALVTVLKPRRFFICP